MPKILQPQTQTDWLFRTFRPLGAWQLRSLIIIMIKLDISLAWYDIDIKIKCETLSHGLFKFFAGNCFIGL